MNATFNIFDELCFRVDHARNIVVTGRGRVLGRKAAIVPG